MLKPGYHRFFAILRAILLIAVILLAAIMVVVYMRLPGMPPPLVVDETSALQWPTPVTLPPEAWQMFQKTGESSPAALGPLASRFRLAGTFFLFGDATTDDSNDRRRAILDDLSKGQQLLVGEGETLDEFEVARVYQDRVILRSGASEYELKLSFTDTVAGPALPTSTNEAVASVEEEPALETNRFGKRVGFNRWVFSRQELVKYYQGLLDDPERIAALYLSLKPEYDKDEQIAGYHYDPEGEEDFFRTVGFQEGDVVRKVNSMNMTSQRRAEYFLGEFVKDRLNAFVFDIERDGKPEKLIYLIR